MIITIPTKTSGEISFISDKFGRSTFFYVYDTNTKKGQTYINENKDGQGGVGVKSVEFVISKSTDVLITPRIGEKSSNILKTTDIKIYKKTDQIVKDVIESYLNGELEEF